jgi:hypothetical protein
MDVVDKYLVSEGMGDSIRKTINQKKATIVQSFMDIHRLAKKVVKNTHDEIMIKRLEREMKEANKELIDVMKVIDDSLELMFMGMD